MEWQNSVENEAYPCLRCIQCGLLEFLTRLAIVSVCVLNEKGWFSVQSLYL